jgi:HK97 family phage portal protein
VIVRTFGGLQALTTPERSWSRPSSSHALSLYGLNQDYAEIYRTQPNVRICVDFLARNIAQLTPHVDRRVSDTDRVRLVDHELARWLGKPGPGKRRYRLFEDLMGDLGVFFNGYWVKVRHQDGLGRNAIGLVRIPANEIHAEGGLFKSGFLWTVEGREKPFPVSEIVHYDGYNPENNLEGLSPLETLRRILAEEEAAGEYREHFWRHGSRVPGVVTRPKEVKRYTKEQAQEWREGVRASYGGVYGEDTMLLQEGETFTPTAASAKDSEYTVGGKLRREICAAAFHIPQPMVGILEHATFSNIREQHKHLYADTLGPWLEMIQQEIEGQLLIECQDQTDVYVEFNIDAKLAGTPEERAQSLQLSVGKPWRTVNEARALENLPRDEDPESDRIAPQQGGPSDATANPTRFPPPADPDRPTDDDDDADDDDADARTIAPFVVHTARLRQLAALGKLPVIDRASAFFANFELWTQQLTADLTPVLGPARAARRAARANTRMLTALIAGEETAA